MKRKRRIQPTKSKIRSDWKLTFALLAGLLLGGLVMNAQHHQVLTKVPTLAVPAPQTPTYFTP